MPNPLSDLNKQIAGLTKHLTELMAQQPPNPARILSTQRALRTAQMKRAVLLVVGVLIIAALVWLLTGRPASDTGMPSIDYEGHHIPLSQLRIVDPHPGCQQAHYHAAANDSVTATDGTVISDADLDCGFGPVK